MADLEVKVIEVSFPLKGLCEECAIFEQPELTTISAWNVVVQDGGGILRGAQRPGLALMWAVPNST